MAIQLVVQCIYEACPVDVVDHDDLESLRRRVDGLEVGAHALYGGVVGQRGGVTLAVGTSLSSVTLYRDFGVSLTAVSTRRDVRDFGGLPWMCFATMLWRACSLCSSTGNERGQRHTRGRQRHGGSGDWI